VSCTDILVDFFLPTFAFVFNVICFNFDVYTLICKAIWAKYSPVHCSATNHLGITTVNVRIVQCRADLHSESTMFDDVVSTA